MKASLDTNAIIHFYRLGNLNWSFRSQISKFIRRFLADPYLERDTEWIEKLANDKHINIKTKLETLNELLKKYKK